MSGIPGNIPGPLESGEFKQLISNRLSSMARSISGRDFLGSKASESQQASSKTPADQASGGKQAAKSGKGTGAQNQQKLSKFKGAASDHVQFSHEMKGQLKQLRRQAIKTRHFRDGLESKFLNFLKADKSQEQIKQAAKFAASSIWDILKKARKEGDDDEIATRLLAMLMKVHSSYTFEHSERVMEWTLAMAEELGIENENELDGLGKASFFRDIGMLGDPILKENYDTKESISEYMKNARETLMESGTLHDIGKMRIPPEILSKVEPLSDEEFEIIKKHPLIGVEIVKPYPALHRAIPGIRHHHEKWDGSGYPDGLDEESIPLAARIITITDTFDAMTEDRPYRKGLSYSDALNELVRLSGQQFDPNLVPVFIRTLLRKGDISVKDLDLEMDVSEIVSEFVDEE
ncbi:MAG: HD-GYP domain-containing protein [Candidatus Eremiobacteraeota bacterium]|nr:HD-GYP domain-containing protein [Candidatus Eremiobacteraeota bacterium]